MHKQFTYYKLLDTRTQLKYNLIKLIEIHVNEPKYQKELNEVLDERK